ncbi:hypothetical protein PsAD46_01372 [Pseudovibrio sp. Ad46]|uniref:HNH endonuclease signature motif containing protein n=1 Tax=unclassified Pseudovibrio TaxID=2627060 RepID=UPI0007AEC895|nr:MULTISPECIES: HNH endonuclease signature motif containing protein [unclassified Pseudovibrio]KZK91845.1 hypothetical protein PsAD46_01372 [Pseudovibrio sp. Ad46]KZL01968.1 hypothetical protein PsAD5_00220 [Pseudovibrio sp. Ad5]
MPIDTNKADNSVLLDTFDRVLDVEYKNERYNVRDNGAVFRHNKLQNRVRPLDNKWSFGKQSETTGYVLLAGVPVHRIVCCAFHGAPPTKNHVVDHIDTNRANNRPENLRWVTRLENVLLNPISARRIELAYGSIEAFIADPSCFKGGTQFQDIGWMRTVSKEEALLTKERFQNWAKSGSVPKGGALDEWLFAHQSSEISEALEQAQQEFESLTPSVVQVNWKTPTAFLCCPSNVTEDAIKKYEEQLTNGEVFCENQYGQSRVVEYATTADAELVVLTRSEEAVKKWAVTHISVSDGFFYHRSEGTFFEYIGAAKHLAELCNLEHEYGECIDDYC